MATPRKPERELIRQKWDQPSPSRRSDGGPADLYNCRTGNTTTHASMKSAKAHVTNYRAGKDPEQVDWILMTSDGALYRSEIAVATCGRYGRHPALCWRRFARKDLKEKLRPTGGGGGDAETGGRGVEEKRACNC